MNKVKIIADSTCDISIERLKELDIDLLSLYVVIQDKQYLDLEEIKWNDVIAKVNETGELPHTAAINIDTFATTFKKYVDQGYDVIFLSLGANFSSNYNNARLAAEEFDEGRVYILDSQNLSSAIGLMLFKMAAFRDQGLSAKEIVEKMEKIIPLTQTETALETMQYLYKGGRCSALKFMVGNILKLYPIVKVEDGVINVHKIGKLTFKNALNIIANDFRKELEAGNVDEDFIIISTVGNEPARSYLCDKVSQFFPKEKIYLYDAGCVVSTHCGPGTTGFFYIRKQNPKKAE
ncbi:MAG: DegV family protein [Acholeplasmatales bacterium]|nr:DegV family protein [Acholeplasmatales bacterium]